MARPPGTFKLAAAILLFAFASVAAQAPISREYRIKAAFLFNFAQFVTWPAQSFSGPNEPLRIGILGEDPFGQTLDETVAGESVRHRKLAIVRSRAAQDLAGCQLVFISRSEQADVNGVLTRLGDRPVLTVSEIPGFAQAGGIINFYLAGNKVRFEINPAAARRGGLKLSSQLLTVGRIVPGSGPSPAP